MNVIFCYYILNGLVIKLDSSFFRNCTCDVRKSESMKHQHKNSVSHSDLPTIFPQALLTPLAIVCLPHSAKIIKEPFLKSCR